MGDKMKFLSLVFAFLLVGSIIPASAVSTDDVNNHASGVANLIKEKCHGTCDNVVILGDDYVIPSFRRDIKWLSGMWFWEKLGVEKILTDIGYVQRRSKTFAEFDDLFKIKYDDTSYQGKNVLIIRPDSPSDDQDLAIDDFKAMLIREGYNPDYEEKISSKVVCNDPGLFSEYNGRTIFVFGTEENNDAFNCFPFQAGLENRDAAFIDVNPWDGRNYAVIVNTDDAEVIRVFTNIIENKGYQNLKSESAYIFRIGTRTAGYIAMGVAVGVLIVGSGGAATPLAIGMGAAIVDGIADASDVVDTCAVNYDGIGWCGVTVGFAILPFIPAGPFKKILKGFGDEFIELFEKGTRRVFGNVDEGIQLKVIWKNMDQVGDVRKTKIFKSIGKIDELGNVKNADGLIDEFTDALRRGDMSQARGSGINLMKGGDYIDEGKRIEFEIKNPTTINTANPKKTDIFIKDTNTFVEVKSIESLSANNLRGRLSDAADQLQGIKLTNVGNADVVIVVEESGLSRKQVKDLINQWIGDASGESKHLSKIIIEGEGFVNKLEILIP